ncbi:hypothetical protein GJ496_003980 [Pomphorhynchus laevis]|nr:hypothetical protein GJ496_003980 [Pomphorhynchus laevis]
MPSLTEECVTNTEPLSNDIYNLINTHDDKYHIPADVVLDPYASKINISFQELIKWRPNLISLTLWELNNVLIKILSAKYETKTTDELENVYILPTKLGGLRFRDPMVEVLNQHSSSIQMCIPFDTARANDREQSQIKIAWQLRIQNLERQKERRDDVEVKFARTTRLLDFASLKGASAASEKSYSGVISWLQARLSIAMARSISQCLRAYRSRSGVPVNVIKGISMQIDDI